jgi:hypothetical protein
MIIKDYRVLKAMERRGFIKTRDGYERHWSGLTVRNYFVAHGPNTKYSRFIYKGEEYKITYIDGCFHPFVVKGEAPAFV